MRILSVLIRWAVLAGAVVLAAWVTPDASLSGGPLTAMWVAVLIALANVVAGLVLRALPSPQQFLLLAVLTLAVNGLAVWVASAFTDSLTIDGFLPAVALAILISIFAMVLTAIVGRLLPETKPAARR